MKRFGLCALAALAAAAVLVPTATAGGSITATAASPGVYFTVAGKASGGRDYFAIDVSCDSGYGTRIFVTVQDGSGTSQTIYPPAGSSCTANLLVAQSINKFRVMDSTTFAT
jgi:hypothetical protein